MVEQRGRALVEIVDAGAIPGVQVEAAPDGFYDRSVIERHLTAQRAAPVDVRIDPIAGTIVGASGVVAVGFDVFDLTPTATQGASPMSDTATATITAATAVVRT